MDIKTIFLISILSVFILKILWNIYLHTIIDDLNIDSQNYQEVFSVSGLNYKKQEAQQACRFYNSELATSEQLNDAYNNGAEWCNTGWLKDSDVPRYPMQSAKDNCGNSSGVLSYLPKDGKAGANCYGVKPINVTNDPILPFNSNKYSQNEGTSIESNEIKISGFIKIISFINLILSIVALVIYYKYLNEINTDKNTKYATYVLFSISIIFESIKIYILLNPSQVINFNNTLTGITASLTATYFFNLILIFYILKSNKVNVDIELDNFKNLEDNFSDNDILNKELDELDLDLLDNDYDLLETKLKLNNVSTEKTKVSELEEKIKKLESQLKQQPQQRYNSSNRRDINLNF
jgi:hypothetical protein